MLWLSFPQNRCYCSSETFAKFVGLVVQSAALHVLLLGRISMTFNKKAFVARNRKAAQTAIQFIVGTFYKFFREVLKYKLNFRCFGSITFGII